MTTLGVIVGNRGFFPSQLCETGRESILKVLKQEGIKAVILPLEVGKFGAIETLSDARSAPTCSARTVTRSTACW